MMTCPACKTRGRKVKRETLQAQVEPQRLAQLSVDESWSLCLSRDCDVVYFEGEDVVRLDAVKATPFHKSMNSDRLVCFCFRHTVSEIEADVREHGTSTIREAIKVACKAGRDDCVRKNPQGRCCLGNVGQVIKQVSDDHDDADGEGCCGSPDTESDTFCSKSTMSESSDEASSNARKGNIAAGSALIAAVLSSACCWLPLLAIGLGASTASVGAVFEAWRVPLFVVAVGLLGAGFFLVYRKPRCAPGGTCVTPDPKLRMFNRGMLWLTTAFVFAFALFPEYVAVFAGGGGQVAEASSNQTATLYIVEGMTCAGCEGHARKALEKLPGVSSAAVSYEDSSASIVWSDAPDHAAVKAALAEFGYHARLSD